MWGLRNSWAILMGIPKGYSKWFLVKSCLYEIVEKWWRISLIKIPARTGSLPPPLQRTRNSQGTREVSARASGPACACAGSGGAVPPAGGHGRRTTSPRAPATSVPPRSVSSQEGELIGLAPPASEQHQKHDIKQRVWGNSAVFNAAAWFWS